MYTVGLTGGIGSGKSLVAKIFVHLGIPVFDADAESKIILEEDPEVRSELTGWFGAEVYPNGKPDRPKLALMVFSDPQKLARLNSLLHPKVMDRFIAWCGGHQDSPYLIHEAAILFESGFYRHLDTTILVTAPENIRIRRVQQRDHITPELVRQRMQNQWSDEQKSPLAGYIIRNDDETPLLPRVLEIHLKLVT